MHIFPIVDSGLLPWLLLKSALAEHLLSYSKDLGYLISRSAALASVPLSEAATGETLFCFDEETSGRFALGLAPVLANA